MSKVFFRNQQTDKRYEVISLDKDKQVVTLRGEHGTFQEPYDPARFKRLGYVLEKDTNDA